MIALLETATEYKQPNIVYNVYKEYKSYLEPKWLVRSLLWAIQTTSKQLVEFYIRVGVPLTIPESIHGSNKIIPSIFASIHANDARVMEMLIPRDSKKAPCIEFQHACRTGNEKHILYFLKHHLCIHKIGLIGCKAAFMSGHQHIIYLLVSNGFNVNNSDLISFCGQLATTPQRIKLFSYILHMVDTTYLKLTFKSLMYSVKNNVGVAVMICQRVDDWETQLKQCMIQEKFKKEISQSYFQ